MPFQVLLKYHSLHCTAIIASEVPLKKKFLTQKSGFLWIKICGKCG
ncbi:hypothetical protein DORFOR_02872 [Dorea formicigenerans ATCC 27755]|uniref:Uncharacterized protein n=1 Tax=Dorea formicigenerans ATCC 27755 TaxID=411461 RepID=B0G9B1_9FIRM|nr:hypothetical protein DORFOR_02872 [Dorea formicigenerans ATCC 27755]